MSYDIYTEITVTEDNQTTFVTDIPGNIRKKDLYVYLNSSLCEIGSDYNITESNEVEFTGPLLIDDTVLFSSSKITPRENVDFEIIGTKSNAIFKRYNAEQNLMNNQLYTINFNMYDKDYSYSFTSAYNPMYTTSKIIRNDLHDIIESVDDDSINFTIWQNGLLAHELSFEEIKEENIPFYVKQYVRYRTEIDLVYAIYLALSGKSGQVSKRLGAMEITRSIKIPFLKDMLGELKDKLAPFEKQLIGVKVIGKSFQKAGRSYPYPIPTRRSF